MLIIKIDVRYYYLCTKLLIVITLLPCVYNTTKVIKKRHGYFKRPGHKCNKLCIYFILRRNPSLPPWLVSPNRESSRPKGQ